MIDRFLRRLTVRSRIIAGFLILIILPIMLLPVLLATRSYLMDRLQTITEVEARADRLLLLASARVESSRVNLMRYIQDYAPSAYEALDDVDQAIQFLNEAQVLITSPEQKENVEMVLVSLADYRDLAAQVEAVRSEGGQEEQVSPVLFSSYRLGNDIGQRIEQIVRNSEARVAAANQAIYAEVQDRLVLLGVFYAIAIILGLILAGLIQRSITRPIADLRSGAEDFRQGQLDATISVVGRDELSLLAQTFNEMAAQLRDLIDTLEARVADRTETLEQRAGQLAAVADVGRAIVSILELDPLAYRVVELVRERFDFYHVGLFLLDDAGEHAVLQAGTGDAGQAMVREGHQLKVGGMSMVGAACATRRARIALDVGDDPVRFDNPLLPDTRSELALPLLVGNRVLGTLDVQSAKPHAFSDEDVSILQLVADQVAVAVDNARKLSEEAGLLEAANPLYRVGRRLSSATTTGEIVQAIIEAVAETEADGCAVGRVDLSPEGEVEAATFLGEWRRSGVSRYPIGVTMQADASPFPLQMVTHFWTIEDVAKDTGLPEDARGFLIEHGNRAYVNVPLRVGGRTIGFVSIHRVAAGAFSPVSIRLYETLVDQAAIALERARLLEETQRRAERDRLLDDITSQLQVSLDPDTILKTGVQALGRALGARRASVEITGPLGDDGNGLAEEQQGE